MKIIHKLLVILLLIPAFAPSAQESNKTPSETAEKAFTEAELEQILAPIALYPDTVLTHVLIASTYPLEVIQAERWTGEHPDILAADSVKMVEDKDWDPSVKALVAFPEILKRLSKNLDWTQKLGDAFLADEEKLLASIQALRQRAYEIGSLDKMDKMKVTKDEKSIIIEPIETQVVYVPYYDTRVVYGPWHWSHYPPVYWHYPSHYAHHSSHHSPFYWGPRVHISFGFFFSSFHWHNRHIVRIPYHHYRPYSYNNRRQVIRHEHANRWRHNPTHRRGVSYRSVTVSNRYSSNRASQHEIQTHRTRTNNQISRSNQTTYSTRRNGNIQTRNNRQEITQDRIQRELRDGRENNVVRNNRSQNQRTQNQTIDRNANRDVERNVNRNSNGDRTVNRTVTRNVERDVQRRVEPTSPPVQTNRNVRREQTQSRERSSNRSSSRSNNRSSNRSSSRSSSRSSDNRKKH